MRLHYHVWLPINGEEPLAIVGIIHGWSDHSGRYGNVVDHLTAHGFSVYGLDLRGHGHSDGQRGHIEAWEDYRLDIHAFLQVLERDYPDTPHFIMGHSMGGLALMEYVIHFPDAPIDGIVATSPLLSEPNVPPIMNLLAKVLAQVAPRLGINPGTDSSTITRDTSGVEDYDNDPLVHTRATPRFAMEMEVARQFVIKNADAIQHPFLLLYGDADGLVPPNVSRDIFKTVGSIDKTRHEYAGGYHELFNDLVKEDMLRDLTDWLNAHLPTSP
jgi:alpha-beta hydrolase superfamily lysophospholipase